jgi:hypothetical protein
MLFTYEYNLDPILFLNKIQIIDVKIEVAFNLIYTMHYIGLLIF